MAGTGLGSVVITPTHGRVTPDPVPASGAGPAAADVMAAPYMMPDGIEASTTLKPNALGQRLIVKILALVVPLVGLVIIVAQLIAGIINHNVRVDALRTRADLLAASQAEALALPMWNLDFPMAGSVLNAVALDPDFVSGRIVDENGIIVSEVIRSVPEGRDIRMTIARPITIIRGDAAKTLGELELVFRTTAIQESVTQQLLIGVAAFAVMIAGLALVLLYILRRLVLTPLNGLLDAMGRVEHEQWTMIGRYTTDEIGQVCATFNRMVQGLQAGQEARNALREAERREEEQEKVAQTLKESEYRLRSILQASPVPIVILGQAGDVLLFANQRAVDLFGIPSDAAATTKPLQSWFDDTAASRLRAWMISNTRVAEFETALRTDHGKSWAAVSGVSMSYGDQDSLMLVINDITGRKLAEDELREQHETLELTLKELREVQESLIQSEKMASLGGLVAGVAHEINTPVGIIISATSHLAEQADELRKLVREGKLKRSKLEEFVDTLQQVLHLLQMNSVRAAELIQSFKQVAVDQGSDEVRQFDLKAYIEEVLTSLRPKTKKYAHTIDVSCPSDVMLKSNPGALSQTLTNLVMNALVHAFDEDDCGTIRIVAKPVDGDKINLVFSDDGKGVPADHLRKIFDPFFTTRRGLGGSGLGLHIVYNVVTAKLRGTIAVTSTPGGGTQFTLEFPRVISVDPATIIDHAV